ncbi:prepilin-type N-terminal cleavage/methylation domain-containing protein [bacterium]|nr:prepilin-type N-terminal cleavage/methylation domain-containing protein [bacterium]
MKKFGFTLAEVLTTLAIVGVVSAITIPLMSSSHQELERAAKVKKIYGMLSSAADAGVAADASISSVSVEDYYNNLFKPYLQIQKECTSAAERPNCWGNKIWRTKNSNYYFGASVTSFVLKDGSSVLMNVWDGESNLLDKCGSYLYDKKGDPHKPEHLLMVYFDINGNKKPNQIGKDVFALFWDDLSEVLRPCYYGLNMTDPNIKTDADIAKKYCNKSGYGGMACIRKYLSDERK